MTVPTIPGTAARVATPGAPGALGLLGPAIAGRTSLTGMRTRARFAHAI